MKKMNRKLLSVYAIVLILVVSFNTIGVFANNNSEKSENILTDQQIQRLLEENEHFRKRHDELVQQGYTLKSVRVVSNVASDSKTNFSTNSLQTNIVYSDYAQPTRRNIEYYSNLCNSISDFDTYVTILAGLTKPYIWIPMTLFGFNTNVIADVYSNGRVETTEDSTLHLKEVYVYDGSWYIGAVAERLHNNIVMTTFWRNAYNDMFSDTVTRNFNYYSVYYNNDNALISIALSRYDDVDFYWESYVEPSQEYLN